MPSIHTAASRRRFLGMLGLGGVFLPVPGAFAQALVETPGQTEGPFYPDDVLRRIRDTRARESVIVDFTAVPVSALGESAARFDIVLGVTPTA